MTEHTTFQDWLAGWIVRVVLFIWLVAALGDPFGGISIVEAERLSAREMFVLVNPLVSHEELLESTNP
jgi:hypothetical protein